MLHNCWSLYIEYCPSCRSANAKLRTIAKRRNTTPDPNLAVRATKMAAGQNILRCAAALQTLQDRNMSLIDELQLLSAGASGAQRII